MDFPINVLEDTPPALDVLIAACRPHQTSDLRDKLEVVVSGGRMGRQPISLRNDGRSATIIVTLPVRYRGGAVIVTEPTFGETEKFVGRGGKNGDLDWVAFLGDCDYEIDTVQSGCRVSISYGVYIKGFNVQHVGSPAAGLGMGLGLGGVTGEGPPLITPSDRFFDLLSPILNMSRGKKLGFFLNHSYNADPSEVVAESLVPQVRRSQLTWVLII